MSKVWLAPVFLACSCAHAPTPAQDQVSALVRQCGLEGKVKFRWVGGDNLTMTHIDADADFEKFTCVLHGLEARGMKLGFEGREQLNN